MCVCAFFFFNRVIRIANLRRPTAGPCPSDHVVSPLSSILLVEEKGSLATSPSHIITLIRSVMSPLTYEEHFTACKL